jgi:hypothetical protein
MSLDYDWKCYFTPNASIPFGNTAGYKRPFEIAYLNIANYPPDTSPKIKQYIAGQRYENGLRVHDMKYIEITKNLMFGSTAQIIYTPVSDRDLFEVVPNEGTGQMIPRMKFPFRLHSINLQSKTDGSMPATPLFFGTLENASVQCISDVVTTDDDGMWRVQLDFKSLDHPEGILGKNIGAPAWHHRVNDTADTYHKSFRNTDNITFDQMITRIVAWMNIGKPPKDFPITFSYSEVGALPFTYNFGSLATIASEIATHGYDTMSILKDALKYMGAVEGLGKKYIPKLTINSAGTTGTITVIQGGYDKTAPVDEDFRSTQGMQKNTSTDMTIRFNLISVPFTASADKEYWIKFTLYRKNGGSWDTVLNIPTSGYEYVPFDSNNVHSRKYYHFPTQEITPEDTYKWDADLVTAGSFSIALVGGAAYSPQTYQFLNSPLSIDYGKLRTLVGTIGACQSGYGVYVTGVNTTGCHDGGRTADGGNQKCIDQTTLQADYAPVAYYPDPLAVFAISGTSVTFTNASATVTGSGTSFATELQPNWKVRLDADGVWATIKSIESNTSLTLTANYSGAGGTGAGSYQENMDNTFGIRGAVAKIEILSNQNATNTLCRLHSKKLYECHRNTGSLIREPIKGRIIFNDGYTGDLVGGYVEVYSPEVDDMVILRVTEQKHIFTNRLTTVLEGFRV